MRRMKEMADIQAGMSFYGDMPSMYSVIVNTEHPLIARVAEQAAGTCGSEIAPLNKEMESLKARADELRKAKEGKKDEEIPEADKKELTEKENGIEENRKAKSAVYAKFAADNETVNRLTDLALLQAGMLKGKALDDFIRRSIEQI